MHDDDAGSPDWGARTAQLSGETAREEIAAAPAPSSGDRVGRYVVLGTLGSGGMGIVLRAHDPQLDREVAIKVIRPDRAPLVRTEARARVTVEARALARVVHRNIVAIYDAGFHADDLYIVMELNRGTTLRGWMTARPRSVAEIGAVFLEAGRGLAAAHAAGIVHHDFKPDNVLLSHDGKVQVADFGLARVLGAAERGNLLGLDMGTPHYMAPEQLGPGAVDARVDQFAFCVSLYEALHGARPFTGTTLAELQRNIAAGQRAPAPEGRRVPRWLKAILARGLATDPADRFASMDELVELIALHRRPLLMRPRVLAGGAALLVVAAAGLAMLSMRGKPPCAGAGELPAGVWDGAARARITAAFAAAGLPDGAASALRLTRHLDDYAAHWKAAREDACVATVVRHEQSEARLDARMVCLDGRLAALRALTSLLAEKENATATSWQAVFQLPPVADCAVAGPVAEWERPPPPELAHGAVVLRQRIAVARALFEIGKVPLAEKAAQAALDEARALAFRPLLAEALYMSAFVNQARNPARTESFLGEAALVAAEIGDDPLTARLQVTRINVVGIKLFRRVEGLALAPVAAASIRRAGGDSSATAQLFTSVGTILQRDGRYVEAHVYLLQAMHLRELAGGKASFLLARTLASLAALELERERLDDSRRHAERALAIIEAELGVRNTDGYRILNILGGIAQQRGDLEAARATIERAHDLAVSVYGERGQEVAVTDLNLGQIAAEQGRNEDALHLFERAREVMAETAGATTERTLLIRLFFGDALRALGRLDEARANLEEALPPYEKLVGSEGVRIAEALSLAARLRMAEGAPEKAAALLERALAGEEKTGGGGRYTLQLRLVELGEAYLAAKRPAEARRTLERAAGLGPVRADRDARLRAALARAEPATP